MMTYSKAEFQSIKDKTFTIVDALRDSQRLIESTENYFGNSALKYMNKRITSPQWKYQLKYSTKLTKRCAYDVPKVQEFAKSIDGTAKELAQRMTAAKMTFSKNAGDDWANWNCKAMYPRP